MTDQPRPAIAGAGPVGGALNGSEASHRPPHFSWEDWFQRASAHQRADAIGLAHQQGILYPYQLPQLTNGSKSASAPVAAGIVATLTRILSGKAEALPSFPHQDISFFDGALDELQKQAVIRALSTPDLFMLQGLPGTGKSRVSAEILLQAAVRGWRVLFLAPHAASLDVILHKLTERQEIFAIRHLEPGEKRGALPAWLQRLTLDEQRQAFHEHVLKGARENRDRAESTCQQRRDDEPVWSDLRTCLERTDVIVQRMRGLRDGIPEVAPLVEKEAHSGGQSSFAQRIAEHRMSRERSVYDLTAKLAALRGDLVKVAQSCDEFSRRAAALEPAYRAKKEKRFWTWAFWRHCLNDRIIADLEAAQAELAGARSRQEQLVEETKVVEGRKRQFEEQAEAERAVVVRAEIDARLATIQQDLQDLEEEQRQLDERWGELCRRLNVRPAERTRAAVEAARQQWLVERKRDEESCQFAGQWLAFVEETGAQLAARLPALANIHAATMKAWQAEPSFHERGAAPYDLLVVEDADALTEADLLRAAHQARRCVLVGSMLAESATLPKTIDKPIRSLAPAPLIPLCWPRLWQALEGSGAWPYSWFRERGQLICQLLPLTKDDLQHLHSEGLADAADIELRILNRPKATPRLAQVAFPPHWTFPDAFAFIVREAQEIPIQPVGRTHWWTEDSARWTWQAAPSSLAVHSWLDLEPGLRLGMVIDDAGDATRIARIEFAREAGWDRPKAEAWLHRTYPCRNSGRTVFLQTPYRFAAPLATTIISLVCANDWIKAALPENGTPEALFEFVAIPPRPSQEWPKDGSGLELDLSATRHSDRLPAELRQGLPSRGFVNYLEAQALIRQLESLTRDNLAPSCRVAVFALYESQVELLRRLVAQSIPLRSRTFTLEVTLPSRMHQRECDIALLSLTRSHPHRCGAFGEDSRELPLALTRARARLIVFADPGMLSKRANWTGPLDHLDANAAHQECLRLSRLFSCAHRLAKLHFSNGAT